jgi:diguanylate cyclase (GGDEF)-like protein
MAVMQLKGPVGTAPEMDDGVRLVVRRVGERVTMMRAFAQFELQASRDPLTGLYNRRSLEVAVERLAATGTPYALAFADLDNFKHLNDVHGHDAGDRALRAFATTLRTSLRPEDVCCRWGGEEFIVVFPGCDQSRAVDAMDRVRATLALESLTGVNAPVTVSVGVTESDMGELFGETVARADHALHRAKAAGRDRVELWQPLTAESDGVALVGQAVTNGVG